MVALLLDQRETNKQTNNEAKHHANKGGGEINRLKQNMDGDCENACAD